MNICPCLIADEPCQRMCPCLKKHSSKACWCCCRGNSEEERKAVANRIIKGCRYVIQEFIKEWNKNIEEGHPERNINP